MEKISTIKDRILTFIERRGIRRSDFYKATGLSDSNFKGKNMLSQPGGDMMVKILTAYPEISADWLLMGAGNMLKTKCATSQSTRVEEPSSVYKDSKNSAPTQGGEQAEKSLHTASRAPEGNDVGIPLIPLSAMAGAFTGEVSVMEYECERYVIPAFRGADFLIQVKGDSMLPTYASGDLVACQRMALNDVFFQWNKTYVLDTAQGPLIKRVRRGSDDDHVLIVSDNEAYESFELSKSQFYGVALVRGLVRLE